MAIPLSPLTAAVQQESPYLEYVQALTIGFPRLKLLADFMSPNHRIVGFNTDADVVLRMKHVDVTVVDHSSIEGVSTKIAVPHRFRDLRALDNHLDIKPVLSGSVRVVLVENISRDVIELLGSRYALDPRFFENHVRGIERFLAAKWSGDKVQRLEDAAPQLIRRPFATVDFARPYRFQNWEEVYLLRAKTTVPRLGNVASNFYMKENVSIYGPVKCKQGYSVCIVICDPILDDRLPSKVHLRTYNEIPLFSEQHKLLEVQFQPRQSSTHCHLLTSLLNLPPCSGNEVKVHLLEKSLALALDFTSAALFELRTRTRVDSRHLIRPKNVYASMLSKLHNSGGWTGVHDALRYSLNSMINIHLNLLPANSPGRQALESELQLVENTHAEVKRRSSHQMDFIGQEQEIAFTQSLERLTMITMLFAPFSTIAQIFSIQDTYRFSYFAAMVIPIVGFCILFGIRGLSRRDARGLLEWCMSVWTAIAGFGRFRRRLGKERDDRSSGSDVEDSSGKAEDPRRNLYKEITARKASLANRTLKSFIKGGERTKNQLSEFQFGGESDI